MATKTNVDLNTKKIVRMIKNNSFITLLIRGWKLAGEGYKHKKTRSKRKQQRKLIFHTLLNLNFSAKWFNTLSLPEYSYIFDARPRLYIKPFRAYISINWSKEKKLKVIFDSYRLMAKEYHLFSGLLYDNGQINLSKIVAGDCHVASLVLGYDHQFRKEGETVLSLICEQSKEKIASVAFSFEEIEENKWICWVGCVQGHSLNCTQSTKSMQKLMHGLRPNSFVLQALQDLCRNLGCSSIYCVSDAAHSYRQKHAVHLPWRHKIGFNYDTFWQENGALKYDKDWFILPLIRTRKAMSELKPKKRAMYRKRYEMLDEVTQNIYDEVCLY